MSGEVQSTGAALQAPKEASHGSTTEAYTASHRALNLGSYTCRQWPSSGELPLLGLFQPKLLARLRELTKGLSAPLIPTLLVGHKVVESNTAVGTSHDKGNLASIQ